jgi:hypothetical protein
MGDSHLVDPEASGNLGQISDCIADPPQLSNVVKRPKYCGYAGATQSDNLYAVFPELKFL